VCGPATYRGCHIVDKDNFPAQGVSVFHGGADCLWEIRAMGGQFNESKGRSIKRTEWGQSLERGEQLGVTAEVMVLVIVVAVAEGGRKYLSVERGGRG